MVTNFEYYSSSSDESINKHHASHHTALTGLPWHDREGQHSHSMKNCSLLLLFGIISVSCSCWTHCVRAAQVDTSTKGTETITETQTCQAEAGNSASAGNDGACKKYPECGLYIAESTIPNAGLGIFTAQAKEPMDPLDPVMFASLTLISSTMVILTLYGLLPVCFQLA
jgi:hypothetical protein